MPKLFSYVVDHETMPTPANLFTGLPHLPDELFTTLLDAADVRIERIISHGHASPADFWYDQPQHEWVIVLKGAARLQFEDGMVEMKPGDFINIPAFKKHRVDWTTPDEPTVWLGVRYGEADMMRPQPLICVRDVEASSRWYQRLLGCQSDHGGPNYERLVHSGKLVLQLHRWEEEHHHGRIGDPNDMPPGNGLLLWFEVDDFDAAIARAEAMGAEVIMPRHRNPPDGDGGPNHWEIWLRDLDGYKVVLASPDGTADGDWRPRANGRRMSEAQATRVRQRSGQGSRTTSP